MSKQVIHLFEQRYQNFKLLQFQDKLKKRNKDLKKFASIVSHDLKSPLANIISLTELLKDDNKDNLNEESLQYLDYLKTSSYSLKDYIDGILKFYKSDDLLQQGKETIDLNFVLEEIQKITDKDRSVTFNLLNNTKNLILNKAAFMQVLVNLVTNAIKYNSKSESNIDIIASENEDFYEFSVKDNADGIPTEHLNKIFDLFSVVGVTDKNGNIGAGIGLASVKKIVQNLGGKVTVFSTEGEGSVFTFTIAKS